MISKEERNIQERKIYDMLQKNFQLVLDVTSKSNIHYQVWDCEGCAIIVDNNRADKRMLGFGWNAMETEKAVEMIKRFVA